MNTPKIFESEYRFCLILWENEPISSAELAKLCAEKLGWSRTTTYTVIKRLSDRGAVKNENSVVTSLVSKEEVQAFEIDELLEKTFDLARELSLSFVSLEVRESNYKAISLYEKLGFEKEGLRKNFYENPKENALIMTKRF